MFCRWLLGTFTQQGDAVLDCFAGTGTMARACKTLHRHCVSVEYDEQCFNACIRPLIICPNNIGQHLFYGEISEYTANEKQQREKERQYHYPPPLPPPMSPTRSTGSSWPPGFTAPPLQNMVPPLPPLPPPSWPHSIEMGRPMHHYGVPTNPPNLFPYGVAPPGRPPYMHPHGRRSM